MVRTARPAPPGLRPGGRSAAWEAVPPAYVALDVDGTLLLHEHVPAREVLDAVAQLVEAGVRVGLATGRMAAATETILGTGVFTGPHVFHNGAVVADASGVEQLVLGLTDVEVSAILELGHGRDDLVVELYVDRVYLVDRHDPRAEAHARLLGLAPAGRIDDVTALEGRPATKAVMMCFSETVAAEMVHRVTGLGLAAGPAASPATPGIRYVNVTRAGVDKGSGVEAAGRSIGVDLAAIAALGDESNDLPALERVGTAIAMGGSAPALIEAAHLVAPTFAEGGAAAALLALTRIARDAAQRAPGTW
jgi:Cof subfamily protein (haloacid dehalogenase superfamily)